MRKIKKVRLNKKGFELTVFTLIEGLLIFLVLIAFSSYIISLRNDTLIEKTAIARDLSLLANTVQASPNDVVVAYNPSTHLINSEILAKDNNYLSKYHFSFTKSFVQIKQQDFASLGYPYYNNLYFGQILQDVDKQNQIVFSLFQNNFVIANDAIIGTGLRNLASSAGANGVQNNDPINNGNNNNGNTINSVNNGHGSVKVIQKHFSCSDVKSTVAIKSIVLDASKGYYIIDDSLLDSPVSAQDAPLIQIKGVESKENAFVEQELTYKATITLENKLKLLLPKTVIKKTRSSISPSEEYTLAKRNDKPSNDDSLVISLRLSKAAENENKIRIYLLAGKNEAQGQKLACLLANAFSEKIQGLTAPISIEYLQQQDDDYSLLQKNGDNLAVVLELGNIQNKQNPIVSQLDLTTDAIAAAIKGYAS